MGLFNPLVEFIVFFSNTDPATTDHWGYKSEDIVMLTNNSTNPCSQPTRKNMLDGMCWLVKDAQPYDSLFFGHSEFRICVMRLCIWCVCMCIVVHALEEMHWCIWCVCVHDRHAFSWIFVRFLLFWFLCMAIAYMASCGLSAVLFN